MAQDRPLDLNTLPNNWAPWKTLSPGTQCLGRPFLVVPSAIRQVRISPPPTNLPLVWRSEQCSCFELPSPKGSEDDPAFQHVTLSLFDANGVEKYAESLLSGGVPRPLDSKSGESVGVGSMPILGSDGIGAKAAELISQHAESINEITFPRQKGGRRPQRAEGLTVCAWSDFDQLFWLRDKEDLGPLRMIVRIAEACRGPLEDICSRPRKALRRIRSLERLDRVQQMDEACLRWFVRQPGRTILQKAGPRQRVLCVIRQDTADTPENRVVHDFLRRCLRECNAYLHECASHLKNAVSRPYRVLLVLRFRSLLQSWLSRSEISRVPLPTGVPRANYVLQYDERYGQIWNWYERLRRKQLSEDEMWRWQHRTWAEHVSLSILHVLSSLQEGGPRYEGRVLLRSDPDCGRFFDSRSSVGTWIYRGNELLLVEAIQGDQLPLATTFSPELEPLLTLGCDLLIIVRSPLRRSPVRVLAIWTSLRGFGDDPNSVSVDWGRALPSTLFSPTTLRITPLLIVPRTSDGNDDQIPRQGRATYLGMTMVNIELPIPVAAHLDWLLGQLVPWLQSGSFE